MSRSFDSGLLSLDLPGYHTKLWSPAQTLTLTGLKPL